jgi:hypothetical protein
VKPNIRIARGQPTIVDIHAIHLPRGVRTAISRASELAAVLTGCKRITDVIEMFHQLRDET